MQDRTNAWLGSTAPCSEHLFPSRLDEQTGRVLNKKFPLNTCATVHIISKFPGMMSLIKTLSEDREKNRFDKSTSDGNSMVSSICLMPPNLPNEISTSPSTFSLDIPFVTYISYRI